MSGGLWIILYAAVTLGGLYLFRGIPILNVALGFPLGAWVVSRVLSLEQRAATNGGAHPAATDAETTGTREAPAGGKPSRSVPWMDALHQALWYALITAALTVIFCWIELGATLLIVRLRAESGFFAHLSPLMPPPAGGPISRTLFFAVVTSPALQVLTTAFGGLIAVLLAGEPRSTEVSHEGGSTSQGEAAHAGPPAGPSAVDAGALPEAGTEAAEVNQEDPNL